MIEVGWFSTKLLLKGELLDNPGYFAREVLIGVMINFFLLLGLYRLAGLPIAVCILISSLITGAIMPYLLKDVRMK
jgi:hypothetical protein